MTKRSQFAALCFAFSSLAFAQEPGVRFNLPVPPPGGPGQDRLMVFSEPMMAGPAATVEFMSTEMAFETGPIKGLPFSAEAVNEFTQTLADGNRITRKTTTTLYRDAEGRTRRETALPALGATSEPSTTIIIMDPVAQTTYLLDSKSKTARKLPAFFGGAPGAVGGFAVSDTMEENGKRTSIHIAGRRASIEPAVGENTKKEELGKRNIEGVVAEGTRMTTTIPAGTIGNERAIEIVHERWYSPELKQVVLSKHTDPRMGETVYRLGHIQRVAPSPSLFEVPGDYTMKSAPEGPDIKMFRRERGPGGPDNVRAIEKIRKL